MELLPVNHDGYTIYVTPDYYMEDGIRMPVGFSRALEIAKKHDMLLPTKDMVDSIWRAADIQLAPRPLSPNNTGDSRFYNNIADSKWFHTHNDLIEDQLRNYDRFGKLIAGHKKDIVANDNNSSRVAIYGWHRTNGKPIQPYSTVHARDYRDYSHGLRLVSKEAIKDGQKIRLSSE
jgi:hypothetical protein